MRLSVYKDTLSARRGADMAVESLVEGLRSRGHDAVLVTDETADASARATDADVCIVAGTNEMLALTDGGTRRPGVKTVLQFHTHPSYPFRHWLRRWSRCRAIRRAVRLADAVQVLLPSHEAALRRETGFGGRVFVIGNASRLAPDATVTDDGRTIVYPAALNADKRQRLLVDSFACVASSFPGWRVLLYGTGKPSLEKSLRRRIESLGLSDRIVLSGYRTDLAPVYSGCSFVAFPSSNEGFPLTIADAAAFGKPVVGTRDTPSVAELVEDDETGLLAAPTVRAYADALARLMGDAGLRRRLGDAAKQRIFGRNTVDAWLSRWMAALAEIVGIEGGGINHDS